MESKDLFQEFTSRMERIAAEPDWTGKHRRLSIYSSLSQTVHGKCNKLANDIIKEIISTKQKIQDLFNQPTKMDKYVSTHEKQQLKALKPLIFHFKKSVNKIKW